VANVDGFEQLKKYPVVELGRNYCNSPGLKFFVSLVIKTFDKLQHVVFLAKEKQLKRANHQENAFCLVHCQKASCIH